MKHYSSLFMMTICSIMWSQSASNQTDTIQAQTERLKEVIVIGNSIIGSRFEARNKTGSANYISQKDLLKHSYTDVNRILKSVPGINIYEEDGFGLRPNISLRGTSPERSAKITLMEDGVLIAPAPYSAPAAYYFPTIGRMGTVEILKGSSQIQYGPNTTGGAINMISTQIPRKFSGNISLSAGNFNSRILQASLGDTKKRFGYLIEHFRYNSEGYKNIDGGGNTGFDKSDYLIKLGLNLNNDIQMPHSLTFKVQYSEEESNETYLGLTQVDFDQDPFRRYRASSEDLMVAEHQQYQLRHLLKFTSSISFTTTAYLNKFKRNWYKLEEVNLGERVSINNILSSPEIYSQEYEALLGFNDTSEDVFGLKANNRSYFSRGIQTKIRIDWGSDFLQNLEIGIRYHEDEEDRFQWVDRFAIQNSEMIRTTAGQGGSDANRISYAKALATHLLYTIKTGGLTITPGIRYENITLGRTDYGDEDPERIGTSMTSRENLVDVWLPGIGANYRFNNLVSVFGGVHKGFSPPGSSKGQNPEESLNYELGSRFNFFGLQGEVVVFYNDYENLLGSDLAASGGTGTLDQFNAGEVRVNGLEALLSYDLLGKKDENTKLPVSLSYTFTDSEFLTDFESNDDIFGEVNKGDEIPYIAKHQMFFSIGLENTKYNLSLGARFTDSFRTKAGTRIIPDEFRVPSNFIIDISGTYNFTKQLSISSNIINAFNTKYVVSRVPAGLRPGHPFGINLGANYRF